MKSGFAGVMTAITGLSVRAANQVVIFGVTLVAAHFLAPEEFGIFAIASALIALIRTLMYAGPFEYLLKASQGEQAPSECLIINFVLAVALSALLVVVVPFSTSLFGTAVVGQMLLIMAPSNLLSAFAAWQESQILREKRVRAYYVITAIAEVAAGISAVALLISHYGLMALVAQIYLRCCVLLISYLFLQRLAWSRRVDIKKLADIFRWSLARYGSTLVFFVSGYGADFFLGILLSPAATGIYRASSRVVTAVSDVFSHPAQIIGATIFSRYSAENETPKDIWPRILGASAFLGWSALAGLAAIAERIVPLMLGAKWTGTGLVIALLCAARALSLVDSVTIPLMVAFNKSHSVFKIQVVTAIVAMSLLWLVARYGVAAAAASAIGVSVMSTLGYGNLAFRTFPGSGLAFKKMMPISILPALVTFSAAKVCLIVMPANVGATLSTAAAVGAGLVGWLTVVMILRRSAVDSIHSLNS